MKPIAIAAGILVVGAATWGALQYGAKPSQAGSSGSNVRGVGATVRPSLEQEFMGKPIYAKLHAAIIGIEKYDEWPRLGCAVNDAEEVRKLLESDFDFAPENVHVLLDEKATQTNIKNLIAGELSNTGEEDGVFVFFAGHGATLDRGQGQTGFLVPVGGSRDEKQYMSTMIAMSEMREWVKQIPAKHVFFALDACYSGAATARRGLDEEQNQGICLLAHERSRLVLTAGGKNEQVVEDRDTGHGLFTRQLIKALSTGIADTNMDGVITAFELASYIKAKVPPLAMEVAKLPQNPQYGPLTDDEGEFLFLTKAARDRLKLKK